MIPLTWGNCNRQTQRQNVEQRLPRTGGGGNQKLLFNDYRVSIKDDEQILEIIIGDGCTL